MSSIAHFDTVSLSYGEQPVVEQATFDIPAACLAACIGPNGAGKSSLLKALLGLMPISQGTITCATKQIAYVPQSSSIDWSFPVTVLDLVLMGSYKELPWWKRPGAAQREQARAHLAELSMEAFEHRHIAELSGGQQQRVFLARALMQPADLYVLDEPFKGVDATSEQVIYQLLERLVADRCSVFVVHHDLRQVKSRFDWVCLLNKQVLATGTPDEVMVPEVISQAYGELYV